MFQIKNVVNYDPEALDLELGQDMERFCKDERIRRLMQRMLWIPRGRMAVSLLGLICAVGGLVLVLFGGSRTLSFILNFAGFSLSFFSLFVLRTVVSGIMLQNTQELSRILDSYSNSPAMRYHSFIVRFGIENMEVWGSEINDSEFEVTLSKMVDGDLKKDVIVYQFNQQDPDGVLTLDVGNETVFKAKTVSFGN